MNAWDVTEWIAEWSIVLMNEWTKEGRKEGRKEGKESKKDDRRDLVSE